MVKKREQRQHIDWVISGIYLALVITGWLMIYSAGQHKGEFQLFDLSTPSGKQFLWILLSIGVLLVLQLFDYRFWESFAMTFYAGSLLLLILVLFLGTEVKGSLSWFTIGGVSFQPSEFAKFTTALFLAAYLSNYKTNISSNWRDRGLAIGIIALPVLIILLQPDAGSALTFLAFLVVLFREGLSVIWYILLFMFIGLFILSLQYSIATIVLGLMFIAIMVLLYYGNRSMVWVVASVLISFTAIVFMIQDLTVVSMGLTGGLVLLLSFLMFRDRLQQIVFITLPLLMFFSLFSYGSRFLFDNYLKPHQQDRINVWLRPEMCDPLGSLYNLLQSKMAIGSGGLVGKGYLSGTMTRLSYVPEQTTDFIFCTIGEETGFVGVFIVIALYVALLWRILWVAERMKTSFERIYSYGIAGILFVHFFTNIGMTMGLMPVIGIPLPFVSYGGSSLLLFTIMLAVLLNFGRSRNRI